jgi:hypothetical protein
VMGAALDCCDWLLLTDWMVPADCALLIAAAWVDVGWLVVVDDEHPAARTNAQRSGAERLTRTLGFM